MESKSLKWRKKSSRQEDEQCGQLGRLMTLQTQNSNVSLHPILCFVVFSYDNYCTYSTKED